MVLYVGPGERDLVAALAAGHHRLIGTDRLERAGGIGTDLDAGAHRLVRARLLEDLDGNPLARQRDRGGDSGNAAAHHGDAHRPAPANGRACAFFLPR